MAESKSHPTLLVVGATGMTGKRVARAAAEFGFDVALAGRNRSKLQPLADEVGAKDVRVVDLDRPDTIRSAMEGCAAVVSTVAPYTRVGFPIAAAAVDAGLDYTDATGEPVYCLRLLEELDRAARDKGVRLVPAAAMSSIVADLATRMAIARVDLSQARGLTIGYTVENWKPSAGSMRSEVDIMAGGAPAVRGGRLELVRGGSALRTLPIGVGTTMVVPDAFVISRYLDLPEIEAFLVVPKAAVVGNVLQGISRLCAGRFSGAQLRKLANKIPDKDDGSDPGDYSMHATVWGTFGAVTTALAGDSVYGSSARACTLVAAAMVAAPGEGGVRAPSEVVDDVEKAAATLNLTRRDYQHAADQPLLPA